MSERISQGEGALVIDLRGYSEVAGVCDVLRQVTFCAAVAEGRGVNRLCVRQRVTEGCPDLLIDLIELAGFDVRAWTADDGDGAEWKMDSFSSYPSIRTVRDEIDRGRLPGETDPCDFLGRWRRIYSRIRPRAGTQARLARLGAGDDCVGVHVRITDKAVLEPNTIEIGRHQLPALTRRTFQAVVDQLKVLKRRKVFLACDDLEARRLWEGLLGRRGIDVVYSRAADFDVSRLRQTSGEDFMVDLFGLSSCRAIVGSVNSGVPVTASLLQGNAIEDILWGRYYHPWLGVRLNQRMHGARREIERRDVVRGEMFCPTLSFLAEGAGTARLRPALADRLWFRFSPGRFSAKADAVVKGAEGDPGEILLYPLASMKAADCPGFHLPEKCEEVASSYRWSKRRASVRLKLRRRDYRLDIYSGVLQHQAGDLRGASINGQELGEPINVNVRDGKTTFRVSRRMIPRMGATWLELSFDAPDAAVLASDEGRELGAPVFKIKVRKEEAR